MDFPIGPVTLIFWVIKVVLLAFVYSSIIFFALWLYRRNQQKKKTSIIYWLGFFLVIAIGLFIYSREYVFERISFVPLTETVQLEKTDLGVFLNYESNTPSGGFEKIPRIDSFIINQDILFGKCDSRNFIVNLKTKDIEEYEDESVFNQKINEIFGSEVKWTNYEEQHDEYWGGIKLYLLP